MTAPRVLSCCAWAIEAPETEALQQLADMGLQAIDIRPSGLRNDDARRLRRDLGLDVCCLAASHEMPAGAAMDSDDVGATAAARDHIADALTHAADAGATCAYVVPEAPVDEHSLERYADLLPALADRAAEVGVRLCIEHFPGTAMPTVAATLGFLRLLNHANLYLLFDIGHAQMSAEDPRSALIAAADRLGYVHLDDNDGSSDLHLALTDGVQSTESLTTLLAALDETGYDGPMSIEMKADLPDPADAIRRSIAVMKNLM